MGNNQIKVKYKRRNGVISTAYVDAKTLFGTDKYTDVEVQLEWVDGEDIFIQTDTWEWTFDFEGTPTRKE